MNKDEGMPFNELAARIQKIINQPIPIDCRAALAWREWGASEEEILSTLTSFMNRWTGGAIMSLRLFDNAIMRTISDRNRKPPEKSSPKGGFAAMASKLPAQEAYEKSQSIYREYVKSHQKQNMGHREADFWEQVVRLQAQQIAGVVNKGYDAYKLLPYGAPEEKRKALWAQVRLLMETAEKTGEIQDPFDIPFWFWE